MNDSSLASELAARLSNRVDSYAAFFAEPSIASVSISPEIGRVQRRAADFDEKACATADVQEDDESHVDASSLSSIASSLAKIRISFGSASAIAVDKIRAQVDENLRAVTRHNKNEQATQMQWLLNSHLAVSAWASVLSSLIEQAQRVQNEEEYWQGIEGEDASGLMYLIQTFPLRLTNALRVLVQRLKVITHSPRPPKSLFSIQAVRRALPPSLLVTSLFPHLSATHLYSAPATAVPSTNQVSNRSLFFLTFSPLLLTRQEVSHKRIQLKTLKTDLARQIGGFVKDAQRAEETLQRQQSTLTPQGDLSSLGAIMGGRVSFLESNLADPAKTNVNSFYACEPSVPSELLIGIQQTLYKSFATNKSGFESQIASLSRPYWLTRNWPYILATPLIGYYVSVKVYSSRDSITQYFSIAKETIRGFAIDWVIDPCLKILATLRHGDSSLAIMGRESLKSDFDSLERMVADFAKDMKLSNGEIADVARRVREGDMTLILGAYENDLKSPLKSAIAGSLVRTLLIQVQKVKVDVDVAMDGIEKMLKSQQLTFAFVGVAPSMVLLYGATVWLRRVFETGPSRNSKAVRKRVWYTLRSIDRILTASLDTTTVPKTLNDVSTGLLLIASTTLREYVSSPAFPTHDRTIKSAFLEDVRDLEQGGAGLEAKIRTFDRLTRTFEKYLRV